jgi:hypothetical protein
MLPGGLGNQGTGVTESNGWRLWCLMQGRAITGVVLCGCRGAHGLCYGNLQLSQSLDKCPVHHGFPQHTRLCARAPAPIHSRSAASRAG